MGDNQSRNSDCNFSPNLLSWRELSANLQVGPEMRSPMLSHPYTNMRNLSSVPFELSKRPMSVLLQRSTTELRQRPFTERTQRSVMMTVQRSAEVPI